jgi:hypothetical protein
LLGAGLWYCLIIYFVGWFSHTGWFARPRPIFYPAPALLRWLALWPWDNRLELTGTTFQVTAFLTLLTFAVADRVGVPDEWSEYLANVSLLYLAVGFVLAHRLAERKGWRSGPRLAPRQRPRRRAG